MAAAAPEEEEEDNVARPRAPPPLLLLALAVLFARGGWLVECWWRRRHTDSITQTTHALAHPLGTAGLGGLVVGGNLSSRLTWAKGCKCVS